MDQKLIGSSIKKFALHKFFINRLHRFNVTIIFN